MSPVELLGFIGGGIGMFFGLPQARRVRAAGHADGVSLMAWVLMFAVNASWASYGLRIESPSVLLTNIVAAVVNGSVVVAVTGHGRKPLLWLPAFALSVLAFVTWMPQPIVSVALVVLVFAQAPQLLESFRSMREGRASVVSLSAMQVSTVSLLCWEGYALLTDTRLMILTTSLALSMNFAIIALELLARRAHAETAVSAEA